MQDLSQVNCLLQNILKLVGELCRFGLTYHPSWRTVGKVELTLTAVGIAERVIIQLYLTDRADYIISTKSLHNPTLHYRQNALPAEQSTLPAEHPTLPTEQTPLSLPKVCITQLYAIGRTLYRQSSLPYRQNTLPAEQTTLSLNL